MLNGLHPSARPVECLDHPYIDFVVRGEPEYTTLELIQSLDKDNGDFKKIQGIGYKENGKTIITETRPPIEDLDALPFPARHLLPMEVYFSAGKRNREERRDK